MLLKFDTLKTAQALLHATEQWLHGQALLHALAMEQMAALQLHYVVLRLVLIETDRALVGIACHLFSLHLVIRHPLHTIQLLQQLHLSRSKFIFHHIVVDNHCQDDSPEDD